MTFPRPIQQHCNRDESGHAVKLDPRRGVECEGLIDADRDKIVVGECSNALTKRNYSANEEQRSCRHRGPHREAVPDVMLWGDWVSAVMTSPCRRRNIGVSSIEKFRPGNITPKG